MRDRVPDRTGRETPRRRIQRPYLTRLKGQSAPECREGREEARRAETELNRAFPKGLRTSRKELERLLLAEVRCSGAIEAEAGGQEQENRTMGTLARFLREPLSRESILRTHYDLNQHNPHTLPGRLREMNLHVGTRRTPDQRRVPDLVQQMLRYIRLTKDDPLTAAAWSHAMFDTIQPFAGGNGPAGRAMIQAVTRTPIPFSIWLRERGQQHQRMLDSGWEPYLRWFLQGTREVCRRVREGEV